MSDTFVDAVLKGVGIGTGIALCGWLGFTAAWIRSIAISLIRLSVREHPDRWESRR